MEALLAKWGQLNAQPAIRMGQEFIPFQTLHDWLRGDPGFVPEWEPLKRIRSYLLAVAKQQIYYGSTPALPVPETHLQALHGAGGLLLNTTGTLGPPRQVLLNAAWLLEKYLPLKTPLKTILVFSLDHIAGWETLWSVLVPGGQVILPEHPSDLAALETLFQQEQPNLLSCSPTWLYFRIMALGTTWLQSIKWLNLGGEPCQAHWWEYFHTCLPQANIRQAFGTTETGNFYTRTQPDGSFFPGDPDRDFRVVEGKLWLRKPNMHPGPLDMSPDEEWMCTGDRVIQNELGAIFIQERVRDQELTAGGRRVPLAGLQEAIQAINGVERCIVDIEKQEWVGEILRISVILAKELELETLRMQFAERFPDLQIPVRWKILTEMDLNTRLKLTP